MRPKGSVQYALALRKFIDDKEYQFDFGFIASSDNHRSKPGTGYKAVDRLLTAEANGAASPFVRSQFYPFEEEGIDSRKVIPSEINTPSELTMYEAERQSSFFTLVDWRRYMLKIGQNKGYGMDSKIKKLTQPADHKYYCGLI